MVIFIDNNGIFHSQDKLFTNSTLQEHRLYANFKKCSFWMKHFILGSYWCWNFSKSRLGHTGDGISVNPEKIEAIVHWKTPRNVTEIKSFPGLTGYYRRFIEGFSRIAKSLTNLT